MGKLYLIEPCKQLAKTCLERALKIFKQFLPEGHPSIKIVEDNLRTLEK
jgi:hypothetical protein